MTAKTKTKKAKKIKDDKPKKPKGFQKGHKSGGTSNKGLITQYDREQLALKKIDKVMVTSYITLNSHLPRNELQRIMDEGKVTTLEGMLIRGLIRAYDTGDPAQMEFYLNRLIGKVPQEISHAVKNAYSEMTNEQLIKEKQKHVDSVRKTMQIYEQTKPDVVSMTSNTSEEKIINVIPIIGRGEETDN